MSEVKLHDEESAPESQSIVSIRKMLNDIQVLSHEEYEAWLSLAETVHSKGSPASAWEIYAKMMAVLQWTPKSRIFKQVLDAAFQSVGKEDERIPKVVERWLKKDPYGKVALEYAAAAESDSSYTVNRLSYTDKILRGIDRDAGCMGPRKNKAA
ncbi:MAG: hypothetical protein O2904_00705 [bacterium]|nr:hypothetical protein [bacterium]